MPETTEVESSRNDLCQPALVGQPRPARPLLSVEQAAERLGISVHHAYVMCREQRMPGVVRVGRAVKVDSQKLESWIDVGGEPLSGGWRHDGGVAPLAARRSR